MYDYEPELNKFNRPIQDVLHFIFLIAFGVTLFTVLLGSLYPAEAIKPYVRYSDKVLHFCAYLGVSFLALGAFPKVSLVPIFISLTLTGGLIELLQATMKLGREASLGDILANRLGCTVPILIWIALVYVFRSKSL